MLNMEDEMKRDTVTRWGPGLVVVAIGAISAIVGLTAFPSQAQVLPIVVATAVLSVALVVIAHVRSWERFAWMPLIGFAFAMSGHVAGAETIAFYGGVLTVVLALAHSIQEERRRRYHPVAH
jgi:CHASE2 domain-containing sensor protein